MKSLINLCLLLLVLCTFPTLSQSSTGDIIGTVTSTAGDDITVAVEGGKMPEIGWSVDLFYVTSSGKELPVGTWKVQSIAGQTVTAVKVSGMGNANKKLKAAMHNRQKQQPVASQPAPKPQRAEPAKKLSRPILSSTFKPAPTRSSQPIQLLGQTAPAAVVQNNKVHARHILVKTEMEAIWVIAGMKGLSGNQLKETFIADARKLSSCPTGKKGGDLGSFERGRMVAEFDNAVFNMRAGTISAKPVKTKYGYHVIYREAGMNSPLAVKPFGSSSGIQPIKNEPSPADKAAFIEYKKQQEHKNKKVTSLQVVRRDSMAFWTPAKYYIGIEVTDNHHLLGQALGTVPAGARVLWINSGPAKRVLKVADIIYEANGIRVRCADHFKTIVKTTTEQKMKLKIQRNYEVIEKTVKLKKLKTAKKRVNAVIEALEEEDLIEEDE